MSKEKKAGGRSAAPLMKECEKCVTTLKIAANGNDFICFVCTFIKVQRAQRKCVSCGRNECHIFCDWCGQGFHSECAVVENENIPMNTSDSDALYSDFCCSNCDNDTEEGRRRLDIMTDHSNYCGECKKPFNACVMEADGDGKKRGYHVNQAVLVEANDVLYNSVITQTDPAGDRVKIHFARWSKTFDDWYPMDDERINESLACDCCNRWFHIGCLPLIKSTGRSKDALYVCPTCVAHANDYHRTGIIKVVEESVYAQRPTDDTPRNKNELEKTKRKDPNSERSEAIPAPGNTDRKLKTRKRQHPSKVVKEMGDLNPSGNGELNEKDAGHTASSHSLMRLLHFSAQISTEDAKQTEVPTASECNNEMEQNIVVIKPGKVTVNVQEPLHYGDSYQPLFNEDVFSAGPIDKVTKSIAKPSYNYNPAFSAFDILREVATQSIRSDDSNMSAAHNHSSPFPSTRSTFFPEPQSDKNIWKVNEEPNAKCDNFNDLHFGIRREMYIRFCSLEKLGLLSAEHAQVLRYLIYPTSERFQDLKFVYLVNKHLPPAQLTTHLLELIQTAQVDKKLIPDLSSSVKAIDPSISHDSVHFNWQVPISKS
uniref:AlNc14C90G5653 protein n=1 Tax=Albugo laibachii Nc14 TaxID=890382 RepID=F0WGC2_9STRA|nr:AlNc14C90G5653 [Albugo laibachii Nc14]|eukprot:CCA20282.1 AlNc14C90G5653 [Albugo laibachii Nc14]